MAKKADVQNEINSIRELLDQIEKQIEAGIEYADDMALCRAYNIIVKEVADDNDTAA